MAFAFEVPFFRPIKKAIGMSIAIAATASLLFATHAEASTIASNNTVQNYVVCFKKALVDDQMISRYGGKINRKFKNMSNIGAMSISKSQADLLKRESAVSCVEPDIKMKISAQTADWGIDTVSAPKAWASGLTGKGVKVAVIDTGIAAHSDLKITGGASFVGYTSSYADDQGHGTHVAGIIAAQNNTFGSVGVAPEVSLYALKALDKYGSGYLSDVVNGIDWAITNKMDIINMSLGAPSGSTFLENAINSAYSKNILVVTAAGNSGTVDGLSDTVEYPARYPGAIAVAAVDSTLKRASFSSTGSKVEIAAPGANIYSTFLNNGYSRLSGTSMATPYVSGILAQLKQQNPTLTAAQLRAKLTSSAVDLGVAGRDSFYGFGLAKSPSGAVPTTSPVPTSTVAPTIAPTPIPTVTPTVAPSISPTIAPTSTPIPTIPPSYFVTVDTNKKTFMRGENVEFTMKAGYKSSTIPYALITLYITSPNGSLQQVNLYADASGVAKVTAKTSLKSAVGTYQLKSVIWSRSKPIATSTNSFVLK